MNLQTCAVLAEEILVFAVYTILVDELKTTIRNHLFPQPARNEWMDGLVIFLALLYQHLLCNVQQEGTRKWCDSTHNTAERKTEVDLFLPHPQTSNQSESLLYSRRLSRLNQAKRNVLPYSWRHSMELLVDIQVSVLGGHMVTANREDLLLKTQVFDLHTDNGGDGNTGKSTNHPRLL